MWKKIAPVDIHLCFLNVYGDQTIDESTVRQWVVHCSSGDSDVGDRPHSGRSCMAVSSRNEERRDQFIRANQRKKSTLMAALQS
jgi:hypothetical protein